MIAEQDNPGTEFLGLAWHKAPCNTHACVEIAAMGESVAMRASLEPAGPILVYPRDAFRGLIASAKAGELDWLVR